MRTTLTLDDDLARELREVAHQEGSSFKSVVNAVLRSGLAVRGSSRTVSSPDLPRIALGGVATGVDLDRALQLADSLEDDERRRRLADGS